MRLDLISRILFIIYCVEAGALFFVLPWGAGWDRTVVQIPLVTLRLLLFHPLTRSVVSAFGILHLVWAVNDLDLMVKGRRQRARS